MMYDPANLQPGPYRWFGGDPGDALPDTGKTPVKHSKGNKDGIKLVRPGLRLVPKRLFRSITCITELADHLFGPAPVGIAILLDAQLRERDGDSHADIQRLCPMAR